MTMKELRRLKNVTQMELAEITGLTQTTISFIEVGKVNPFKSTQTKIETALGQSVDWRQTKRFGASIRSHFKSNK